VTEEEEETVAEFKGRTLALLIQAVDGEILRLRALPDERTVPEDEERLVAFENLADELADAYDIARQTESSLPLYERLVLPRG
jgi:hypothetical protein